MMKESRLLTYCNSLQQNMLSDLDKIVSTPSCLYGKNYLPETSEHFFSGKYFHSLSHLIVNYAKHLYDAHELQLPKKTHIAMTKIATSYKNQFTTQKRLTIAF